MSVQNWGILGMALGGFVLFLIVLQFRKGGFKVAGGKPKDKWPFQPSREGHLMTDGEWHMYERLRKAMGADGHVFAQVALERLLEVKETAKVQRRGRGKGDVDWGGKLRGEVVDFVVTDGMGKILAVVELGNASESQENQKAANEDKDSALEGAGIPVFRWTMRTLPKAEEIKAQVTKPRVKDGEYEEVRDEDHDDRLPVLS